MAELLIRPATNADAPAIRELVADVLREYGLDHDPSGTDADLADIETHYLAAGGMFEVVVDPDQGGRVVGTMGMYPHGAYICELRKMYLRPEARGRGLGRQLMERALAFARERGFWRLELETANVLREALSMYRKYGFRPVTSDRLSERCDQAYALDLR